MATRPIELIRRFSLNKGEAAQRLLILLSRRASLKTIGDCLESTAGWQEELLITGALHLYWKIVLEHGAGFSEGDGTHGSKILGDVPKYADIDLQIEISQMSPN